MRPHFVADALIVLTLGSLVLGCSDSDDSKSSTPATNTPTNTGASASVGSRFWYVNDTFGNALKTHTASEAASAAQVLVIVNQERQAAGVAPLLTLDLEAQLPALAHSHDMIGRNFFDHFNPENLSPADRVAQLGGTGYSAVGENIAAGQADAAAVMVAWMNSAGHRANILTPNFTHLGVGVVEGPAIHWTQVFLRRP